MSTIVDVAARAGVSTATVSRYLRGDPVRAADAVGAAIAALRYRPNVVAQSLKSGRTGAIGVVVPDVTNPFFAAVVKGLERASREAAYRVLLANTDESAEREAEVLADLAGRVDGFIVAPTTEQDQAPLHLLDAGVSMVFIDRELAGAERCDVVLVDNEGGGRAAAEHLAGLGHRRVAMINGPRQTTPGRGRRDGFLDGLAAAGLELPADCDVVGDFREDSGYQLALQLLALPDPPTAIFTANNLMTVGALKALGDLRVAIPRQMSLIGFDDLTLGSLLTPGLTCIARPDVEQGSLAMQLLLGRLAGRAHDEPRRLVLRTELLVRGSTAPPEPGKTAPGRDNAAGPVATPVRGKLRRRPLGATRSPEVPLRPGERPTVAGRPRQIAGGGTEPDGEPAPTQLRRPRREPRRDRRRCACGREHHHGRDGVRSPVAGARRDRPWRRRHDGAGRQGSQPGRRSSPVRGTDLDGRLRR